MATEGQWYERKYTVGRKAWGAPYLISRADWITKAKPRPFGSSPFVS